VEIPGADLATPIADAICVDISERASSARATLRDGRFDQAPVVQDGALAGWVLASRLGGRGFVGGAVTSLRESVIVSGDSSVGDVLRPVAERGLVFLAGRRGIDGFIVSSDFDRHAVRSHLYLRTAEIEMLLAGLVRSAVHEEDVKAQLRGGERKRFEAAQSKGRETHPVEYLYLSDYVSLAGATPGLTALVDARAGLTMERLSRLVPLRNCVAHPSTSLLGTFEPLEVAELSELADGILAGLRQASLAPVVRARPRNASPSSS
jgi:CBS domain-containing protein